MEMKMGMEIRLEMEMNKPLHTEQVHTVSQTEENACTMGVDPQPTTREKGKCQGRGEGKGKGKERERREMSWSISDPFARIVMIMMMLMMMLMMITVGIGEETNSLLPTDVIVNCTHPVLASEDVIVRKYN